MIVRKFEDFRSPVFVHLDSCPSPDRSESLDNLICEIKDHLTLVSYSQIENDEVRNIANVNLDNSKTLHSCDVTNHIQDGVWECGYNVMYITEVFTTANCEMLSVLSSDTDHIDIMDFYVDYNALAFRKKIATQAFQTAIDQRHRWTELPDSYDSTAWLPCQILHVYDFSSFGVWYKVNFRIGSNNVRLLCQLPIVTEGFMYWKHTM